MKKILVLLAALAFMFAVAGLVFAADVNGTITKIDGKKVTVKSAAGKEATVEVKDASVAKVGDRVNIKDGVMTKKKAVEGC